MKSTVERKKPLLDEVVEEETELELVLGELGLRRKRKVESKSKKVAKAHSTRQNNPKVPEETDKKALSASGTAISVDDLKEVEERARLAILQGKEDTSQMVARLVKGIWLSIEEQESELKKVEAKANLDETTEECDRLGRHLMLKGYSQEEVDAIKTDTYAEEEEEEAEMLKVIDGLNGVSPQTVLDNQGDDVELPVDGSENVELDASRVCEDHTLMCNRKFTEQFDKVKEVNENREDQYIKTYFRLEKFNQVVSNLTRQVEEKESRIKKGLEDLSKAIECTKNLQR
ncbi:hypothetical protein GIB67_033884 [Kingdonia uniflora]|uniref:Uncharacterized protein n=1 Tax=Kingdonia uniflora TaxID=39325 RepID=A0A7J7MIV1_9MAGN|nr:hypothetical protein GIB67_033884 [Kingdonia uniflora]